MYLGLQFLLIKPILTTMKQILRIRLYIRGNSTDSRANFGHSKDYGDHGRIRTLYNNIDLSLLIENELEQPHGRVLVSGKIVRSDLYAFAENLLVAAEEEFRDEVRHVVALKASERVRLHFSSFQPTNRSTFWPVHDSQTRSRGVL